MKTAFVSSSCLPLSLPALPPSCLSASLSLSLSLPPLLPASLPSSMPVCLPTSSLLFPSTFPPSFLPPSCLSASLPLSLSPFLPYCLPPYLLSPPSFFSLPSLADHRWAVTGTPIQNKLNDFYSLIRFIRLAPFDNFRVWKDTVERKR